MPQLPFFKPSNPHKHLFKRVDEYKRQHHGRQYMDAWMLHRAMMADGVQESEDSEDAVGSVEFDTYSPGDTSEKLPHYFAKAIRESKHPGYLTPYGKDDFAQWRLFKVKDKDAGYALKPAQDGGFDIVAVHNNSGTRGLARALLAHAKTSGGDQMDHFDGKLSRIYEQDFPTVTSTEPWSDEYAPPDWEYLPVEWEHSIHHHAEHEEDPSFDALKKNYSEGKPSVVYRRTAKVPKKLR